MDLTLEAKFLAARTGLRWQACRKWMAHVGLQSITDLRTRYPGKEHAECMANAITEIEDFICGARHV